MSIYFRVIAMLVITICWCPQVQAQSVAQKLSAGFTVLLRDAQLAHASTSLYVVDAKTGEVVYDYNGRVGLAPASTQKVVTSVTAFEMLGTGYRYKTEWAYTGRVSAGKLNGDIVIRGTGDPTLGSWRYGGATADVIINEMLASLKKTGITDMDGIVYGDDHRWESATVPGGWIWDDLGNYYGAGASALNWRENQYDIYFSPGAKVGDRPAIIKTVPSLYQVQLVNELTSGAKGSGDNAYIYLPPYSSTGFIRGSIPQENNFMIAGSFPNPALQTAHIFSESLKAAGYHPGIPESYHGWSSDKEKQQTPSIVFYTHSSPPLDSIIYWFNKKSINLYGEALIKTLATESGQPGSTERGLKQLKEFWKARGIDPEELDMSDGCGLSPQNRITTHAQVEVLKYAMSRPWFPAFQMSLPEYNNMKMKSGTIRKVKGFCGYHYSAAGRSYIFSMLVNNYQGNTPALVNKMYKVLDVLK